jgi:hypothetical protein
LRKSGAAEVGGALLSVSTVSTYQGVIAAETVMAKPLAVAASAMPLAYERRSSSKCCCRATTSSRETRAAETPEGRAPVCDEASDCRGWAISATAPALEAMKQWIASLPWAF